MLGYVYTIPIKMSGYIPKGRVPELSPALIEKVLSFRHVEFIEETIGQPYKILVCNKSYIAFQVS